MLAIDYFQYCFFFLLFSSSSCFLRFSRVFVVADCWLFQRKYIFPLISTVVCHKPSWLWQSSLTISTNLINKQYCSHLWQSVVLSSDWIQVENAVAANNQNRFDNKIAKGTLSKKFRASLNVCTECGKGINIEWLEQGIRTKCIVLWGSWVIFHTILLLLLLYHAASMQIMKYFNGFVLMLCVCWFNVVVYISSHRSVAFYCCCISLHDLRWQWSFMW